MKSKHDDKDALDAAATWRVRRDAGLTGSERAEFAVWLKADFRNRTAWEDVNATMEPLEAMRASGWSKVMVTELSARRKRRWWKRFTLSTATLAAAALAFLAWPGFGSRSMPPIPTEPAPHIAQSKSLEPAPPTVQPPSAESAPLILRNEVKTLADGSQVELSREAEIAVQYTPARRGVQLLRGKAFFTVAKNPSRPFVVTSGPVSVRAVGTQFAVEPDEASVSVVVTEGQVSVNIAPSAKSAAPSPPPPLLVATNEQLDVPTASPADGRPRLRTLEAREVKQRLSWREPRMQLSGTPLRDAVAVLNRVNSVQIEITDTELANLRLTGTYRLDDARSFVRALESFYGVHGWRRDDGTLVLSGR